MKQWMFNGIWRVQVTDVAPLMDGAQQIGWTVTQQWRNGTNQVIAPGDTFLMPEQLEMSDGTTINAADSTRGGLSGNNLASHDFPASALLIQVQEFIVPNASPANKPKALDIAFDAARLATVKYRPQFTTGHPDYRIKLDCTATGTAAQAQGGSSEIPGKDGCIGKWMSNGVWRMRVTAINPDMNPAQVGWALTEQWMNVSKMAIAPGDMNVGDQQLVLTSGQTISSTNSAGSSIAQGQLMFHTFPPGTSFEYNALFRPSALDVNDAPVKVIVTFDAVKERQLTRKPQYTVNPPNFRIALHCGQ